MIGGRCRRIAVEVGLEHVDGAGPLTTRHRVDEDGRGRLIEQGEGQVESADAVIGDTDALGVLSCRELPGHLDSEAIVAQEDVADPRDENGAPRS